MREVKRNMQDEEVHKIYKKILLRRKKAREFYTHVQNNSLIYNIYFNIMEIKPQKDEFSQD